MSLQNALTLIRNVRSSKECNQEIKTIFNNQGLEGICEEFSNRGLEFTPEELQQAFRQDWAMRWFVEGKK